MDGNAYNYAAANVWGSYGEGFQPAALDLQNYIPNSRDHFNPRDSSKNPYVLFNYNEDNSLQTQQSHPHPSHQHVQSHLSHHSHEGIVDMGGQWNFPSWPKVKPRPEFMSYSIQKRMPPLGNKVSNKALDGAGMCLAPQGESSMISLPPPGGFCAPDVSDRLLEELHRFDHMAENNTEDSIPSCSNPINQSALSIPPQSAASKCRSSARKNPAPRKRKVKPKSEDDQKKKRIRDEDSWARNVRKKARLKGEAYISVSGKPVQPRSVKPVDCSKCKFGCPKRVSEDEREKLFKEYWGLGSYKDKLEFITSCVEEFTPIRSINGRRAFSRRYMLTVNGKEERVCKEFFVATFDVSESTVITYMDKKRKGLDAIADLRGKQTPCNKTPVDIIRSIREHILAQTGLKGELTRHNSDDQKNVKKLYEHYQAECESEGQKAASISMYRKVYGDMHNGKTEPPVEIPFEELMDKDSPSKNNGEANTGEDDCEDQTPESPENDSLHSSPEPVSAVQDSSKVGNLTGAMASQHHTDIDLSLENSVMNKKSTDLNIPFTVMQQREQFAKPHLFPSPSFQSTMNPFDAEKGQPGLMLPFMWGDSGRTGPLPFPTSTDINNYGLNSSNFPNERPFVPPTSSRVPTSLFGHSHSETFTTTAQGSTTQQQSTSGNHIVDSKLFHNPMQEDGSKPSKSLEKVNRPRKRKDGSKAKKEPKKRARNEDSWGRNIRKRLRFKGEEYVSVTGKVVGAKNVQKVDCSKCKFQCTTRINEEQREELNKNYWALDTYKKKIEYITEHVETYTPKRKMTGRRAFSRRYCFYINDREERVCKSFFRATLHVSESTIATALEKARKGESAIVDMRGKHKPVNKTTEDTLQSIRELVIYVTGLRPRKASSDKTTDCEYQDIHKLYQVYQYDCKKKEKKAASMGIFRGVLMKEFNIKSVALMKPKKKKVLKPSTLTMNSPPLVQQRTENSDTGPVFPSMMAVPLSSANTQSHTGFMMGNNISREKTIAQHHVHMHASNSHTVFPSNLQVLPPDFGLKIPRPVS